MNPVRQGAAWVYRVLITLFAAAVVVEVFLAGLAIFRAMPGEDESVSHETIEDKFEAHAGLGDVLAGGSLLLLIVILMAWTGPRSVGATFALAVLTVVQGILGGTGEDAPVAGAFHAVNAFLILGLALFLAYRAWRGNLLIPPSQLRGGVRLRHLELPKGRITNGWVTGRLRKLREEIRAERLVRLPA